MEEGSKPKETPSLFRKKKKDDNKQPEEKKKDSFDQEKLNQSWNAFKNIRIENGAGDMEQLLLSRKLEIKSESDLVIHLNSALEISILERFEHELINHLRKELNNDFISIEKEVKEEELKEKLYTSSDKYEYMSKINPELKKLKERLGLDFEY